MSNATPWVAPKKANALRDRLLTNDELMASAQDFVEWLVPDILTPDELFILGMPPRGGKSLFCLTLAKAVATGGHFLDRPVTQGAVIYVNLEDNPTKIKQRQLAQSWGENLPVYWLDKFKLSELDSLKELADELPDLRLVVLDTFSRVRDDNQKESSAELGKTLEPLQEWAKERGICVLITHHTGKVSNDAPNADPFDMLRGSTSIRATCRGAIVIVPGDSSYRLLAENGFSDRLDVSVRINSDTLEWKLLGNWTPRIDGDMKTQIIDHLNLTGDATFAEIAADLNFNAGSVSTIMSRLYRDDLVSKVAGKGGKPAIYKRLSNSLKQLEAQFEASNVDTASDTGSLKQDTLSKEPDGKVINGAKSDQIIDHFSKKPPTHPQLFERSHSQDGAGDTLSNSDFPSLRESNGSHVDNPPPALDADQLEEGGFIYWSEVSTLVQIVKVGRKTAKVRVPGERNPRLAQIDDLGEK
jgi:predicted transcriptional regulator